MNILICGAGAGSWTMRGQQLGTALGARVRTAPTPPDFEWADIVVIVKRAASWAVAAHQWKRPIVWDALDFWRQPAENAVHAAHAQALLQVQIQAIRPTVVIGATQAMATAAAGVYLPHHSWAELAATAPREQVRTVAYEGNPVYLGAWHARLVRACAQRGWQFVINPPRLSDVDILVALRDGPWDGWMCREWKSGVKVVNAIAAGRPVITQHTAAFRELAPAGTAIETEAELTEALDQWTPREARAVAVDQPGATSLGLAAVAATYRQVLDQMVSPCRA